MYHNGVLHFLTLNLHHPSTDLLSGLQEVWKKNTSSDLTKHVIITEITMWNGSYEKELLNFILNEDLKYKI